MHNSPLTHKQLLRYQRQISLKQIGTKGQASLLRSKVLLIGFGGLGQPCAQYLVAAGVGHLTIFDPDQIEQSNLHRQPLFNDQDIGKSKVEVAKRVLGQQNPEVCINIYKEAICFKHLDDANQWKDYDLIIDASDNMKTRYIAADLALKSKKSLIHASILRFSGMITRFDPQGPCYRCLFPEVPSPQLIPSCAEAGVIGPLPGLMGSLMALEAIKAITGQKSPLKDSILQIDGQNLQFQHFVKNFEKDCPACQLRAWHLLKYPDAKENICPKEISSEARSISIAKAWPEKNHFLWIDIRSSEERANGTIPNSIHIEHNLMSSLQIMTENKPIILFCQKGLRSRKALDQISPSPRPLFSLIGGYEAWLQHHQDGFN